MKLPKLASIEVKVDPQQTYNVTTVPVIIDFTEREGVKFETFTSIEFTKFYSPPF